MTDENNKTELNVSALKEGMIFKNRVELCDSLGVTPVDGKNPRDAQDKEFRRYFDFERIENSQGKSTHKIKIIEVYETVRPKEKGNYPAIYSDHIEIQLLHYLASCKNENGDYFVSKNELVTTLGFVNDDFYGYRGDTEPLIDKVFQDRYPAEWLKWQEVIKNKKHKYGIDLSAMDYAAFFQESSNAINGYLDTAFKGLVKRGVIKFKETYRVKYPKKPMREADQDTLEQIEALRNETFEELNCKGIGAVYYRELADKFYEALNSKLSKTLGISKCWSVYKFNFAKGVDNKTIQNHANTDETTLLAAKDSIRREFKARMSKSPEWAVITDYVIDDLDFSPL